jgi:hypothetical protein
MVLIQYYYFWENEITQNLQKQIPYCNHILYCMDAFLRSQRHIPALAVPQRAE